MDGGGSGIRAERGWGQGWRRGQGRERGLGRDGGWARRERDWVSE